MFDLEELQTDLKAAHGKLRDFNSQVEQAMAEFSSIDNTDADKVKEYYNIIGELSVRIAVERTKCSKLEQKIEEHVKRTEVLERDTKPPVPVQDPCTDKNEDSSSAAYLSENMQSHVSRENVTNSNISRSSNVTHIAKPPKLKAGADLCIFLDRFEQFYILSGESHTASLDLRLLNLIEDDKMYRKFKIILSNIMPDSKRSVNLLKAAIKTALYPETETRTFRDSLYKMKQNMSQKLGFTKFKSK